MAARRLALLLLLALASCTRGEPLRVTEAGVPDAIARPLLREFGEQQRIEVETPCRDDCDVLWSDDLAAVLAAQAAGQLAPLPGGDYGRPPSMVDPDHRWVATTAVARVLVYDPQRLPDDDAPTRVEDLARAGVAPQLVLADPTRGHAAWHAAALFAALGEPRARALYRSLADAGAQVVDDEDAVVAALLAGHRALALTDSDRAFAAQDKQPSLVVSVPDQQADGRGALLLPTLIAVMRRGVAKPASGALLDFLLSAPVARRTAMTSNTILVLRDAAETPAGILTLRGLRVMPVSYADLAARLPAVRAALASLAGAGAAR